MSGLTQCADWYLQLDGRDTVGPGTTDALVSAIRRGDVKPGALVCRVGGSEWVTLSAVPEFAAVLREVLPPPPSASQAAYVQPLAAYGPPSIPHGAPMAFAPAPQVIYVQAPALYRPTKSRAAYVLLGLFLGPLGIHNFYAGYAGRAVVQLLITLALGWMLGVPIVLVWIWNLIEVVAVTKDAAGYRFA